MYRKIPSMHRFGATLGWGSQNISPTVMGAPGYHFDSMLDTAEENIHKLEDIAIGTIQNETQK